VEYNKEREKERNQEKRKKERQLDVVWISVRYKENTKERKIKEINK